MRIGLAALAAVSVLATPALAGVYVDVIYSGTATGVDGGRLFDSQIQTFTNAAFTAVYSFYEDEGPETDYHLGTTLTVDGNSFMFPGTSQSGDRVGYGVRISSLHTQYQLPYGPEDDDGRLYLRMDHAFDTDGVLDSLIEPYSGSGDPFGSHNRMVVRRYGYGHSGLSFKTTSLDVLIRQGDPPACCATNLQTFIPEPSTWALLIAGFGAAGAMLRQRRIAFN